jgi:putative spermidine/putrescine transport system permease protein
VFFDVVLPLIGPGVFSGALFAFVTSCDEVVVALFMTGPAQRTLPRQMFDGIRENISPMITAVATLLVLLSLLLMATMELLRQRNVRMRGIRE